MFFKKKDPLTPKLYDDIAYEVAKWCTEEMSSTPTETLGNTTSNALLNFVTFDIHTLITTEGRSHMVRLLKGTETNQTVMIRLKDLVVDLYLKYGDEVIDAMISRSYQTMENMYGLPVNGLHTLDGNNTLWLHPFVRRWYNEIKLPKAPES